MPTRIENSIRIAASLIQHHELREQFIIKGQAPELPMIELPNQTVIFISHDERELLEQAIRGAHIEYERHVKRRSQQDAMARAMELFGIILTHPIEETGSTSGV